MNPRIHRNGLHAFFSRQHALLMEARSRPIGDSVRARRTGRPHRHLAGGLNAKPSRDRKRAVSDEVRNPKERGGSTMPAARLISAISASRARGRPRRPVPNPNRAHQPTIPSTPGLVPWAHHRSRTRSTSSHTASLWSRLGWGIANHSVTHADFGMPSRASHVGYPVDSGSPKMLYAGGMEDYPRNLTEFRGPFCE